MRHFFFALLFLGVCICAKLDISSFLNPWKPRQHEFVTLTPPTQYNQTHVVFLGENTKNELVVGLIDILTGLFVIMLDFLFARFSKQMQCR